MMPDLRSVLKNRYIVYTCILLYSEMGVTSWKNDCKYFSYFIDTDTQIKSILYENIAQSQEF